jgi:5-methylcytosine-specific restriction endonuclease McrA
MTETGTNPRCELCGRTGVTLTVHHLVPKDEDGHHGPRAQLCSGCHRQIHRLFDNATLARELDTVEKLRAHPELAKFVRWIRRQHPGRRIRVR